LPTRSQPQSCINRRLLCPSLASTLRNPILPKAISKRKHVGLDEPNFDEDAEKKRPNAGQEYDPDGDYIYDARKYFNPEKYREIIANQEEKKKLQDTQKKFYYKAFHSHRRHYYNRYNCNNTYTSVNNVSLQTDILSSSASSLLNSEYSVYDIDEVQDNDSHKSRRHKKEKKKSKHSRHRSHTSKLSHKHAKRKKNDDEKKHKKKRKKKKSNDGRCKSLHHNYEHHSISGDKHCTKLRHRLRHRSKLFSPQELNAKTANCDHYGYRYCDQNCAGNEHGTSDPDCLRDGSVSGSNYDHSSYADNCAILDRVESYSEDSSSNDAESPVIARDEPDVWDEDSSVSSECSDVNGDSSPRGDNSNHDGDVS